MKDRLLFFLIALSAFAVALPAAAQDDDENAPGPWSYGAILGLNLSQSAFSNNWAGGDKGSITWVLKSDLDAERQLTRSFHLSNALQLAYGQTAQQVTDPTNGKKTWDAPDKTTDLVQFESLGRFTFDSWVDPYVGFRLDSQFIDDSDPLSRDLMFNPLRLKETGGVARVFSKTETAELISLAGFGFRQNVARSFTDVTGATDETESFTTNDGGFEFQTDATYPIAGDRIQYKGQLLVFFPLFFSASDELDAYDAAALAADPNHEEVADFWKTPDVNFQNTFDAKVTEWLSVNLYLQWIYDKFDAATNVDPTLPLADVAAEVNGGIRKSGQFKQTLALAVSYRFL